jgi:hypothetical protein
MAILALALYDPTSGEHINMCVFDRLGFPYCPGCGLGRSISFLLHGDISNSLKAHPLGAFALIILIFRTYKLINQFIKDIQLNKIKNG